MCHAISYGRRSWLAAIVVSAAVWLAPDAPAQEADEPSGPLLKADLVRIMAVGDYTADELVHIVQMNCVSFRPTERDRRDLLALPGGETVLSEIRRCRSTTGQVAGFDQGIPRANPIAGTAEEPPDDLPSGIQFATLPADPLSERPALVAPRFVMVVQDDKRPITASEVPPRLENWDQVSSQLLREYRPNQRRDGRVVLRVRVDETGRAADSLLSESSGDPYLDAAVLATVSVMRFTPAMSRDRRVAAWTDLPIEFETP
jgi:TonB family protein